MSDICLYYGLETCARVTMTALEEIGMPFSAKRLDLFKEEHKASEYLAINPSAEVPALIIDGSTLTQNAAILYFLASKFPAAGLLPSTGKFVGVNEPLQDLIWCSSTLHILRRQVLNPRRFTTGPLEGVRSKGMEGWGNVLPRIEKRLADRQWWYGDEWSIVDVYLNWSFSGLMADWLKIADRPVILNHEKRVQARPSYIRALNRERSGVDLPTNVAEFFTPGPSA